ncbi:hypothetical protein FB565_000232 [Actinoplanes lutulentus]|uniref:HNH endonuclease n=1 Tax=Actinoplanes lutulentus TaxID=1287878 RepID=A0A327YUB1_9ACTN|nr:hypothetical protein [Actinoplanes lutulentus]MBB2940528.1 hypothetical protein [Actinoplanes lutulentus]RAK24798.1 hypothetical protein B0I29_1354 [Actinoplanes lutulentus]
MPTNERKYGRGVVPALSMLSQGTCYWPSCNEPITRFVDGIPVNNFEIAHIRAANEGGRRYVKDMTDEERNSFDNLVLLCGVHHKIVDKIRPNDFSIQELQDWKMMRERSGLAALRGLRGLTEDRLQELIAGSFTEVASQIDDAVDRLAAIDAEAADLLRPLVEQLAELKFSRQNPDEDVAGMLLRAGQKLGHLADTAPMLGNAADKAAGLEDAAHLLVDVIRDMKTVLEGFHQVESRLRIYRDMM